jgi:hypothetical protein
MFAARLVHVPQVRKRAQSSSSEMLAALQGSPANLAAASEAIVTSE